jgi:hypothetical protein
MGSNHQLQESQGLSVSQQPDMVIVVSCGGLPGAVYHVMGPGLLPPRTIFVLFVEACAYGLKRGRRRGRLGVGARVLRSPQLLHAGAAAALGEALRGAGVPTPHAELRHADVTLSPRRPRSCGQR